MKQNEKKKCTMKFQSPARSTKKKTAKRTKGVVMVIIIITKAYKHTSCVNSFNLYMYCTVYVYEPFYLSTNI